MHQLKMFGKMSTTKFRFGALYHEKWDEERERERRRKEKRIIMKMHTAHLVRREIRTSRQ